MEQFPANPQEQDETRPKKKTFLKAITPFIAMVGLGASNVDAHAGDKNSDNSFNSTKNHIQTEKAEQEKIEKINKEIHEINMNEAQRAARIERSELKHEEKYLALKEEKLKLEKESENPNLSTEEKAKLIKKIEDLRNEADKEHERALMDQAVDPYDSIVNTSSDPLEEAVKIREARHAREKEELKDNK